MSENNNNGPEEVGDKVDGRSSAPSNPTLTRRERSPSAMSQSSAVLEWDPSADVGAMGNIPSSSGIHHGERSLAQNSSNQFRSNHQEFHSSCDIVFGPTFDAAGRKITSSSSRPNSRNAQSNPVNAYSTPSASPVPLSCLDYSPVAPQVSSAAQRRSQENLNLRSRTQQRQETPTVGASNTENSSGSNNNNDELTEGKRTPGRVVSEASTDWEYGSEKNASSKYVSDWQTNGITRSEIEYRNRKKSGSSTSVSSMFLLQVEAHMKNQSQGSPPDEDVNKSDKFKESHNPIPQSSTESSEFDRDRKIQNIVKRPPRNLKHPLQFVSSSESDPSSMCLVVKNFLRILEENPAKDRVKYDVLKTHRDYHMTKVYKQITKLEKLNQALLAYKRRPKERTERLEPSYHGARRIEVGHPSSHHVKHKNGETEAFHRHDAREKEKEIFHSTRTKENQPLRSKNEKTDRTLERGYASEPSTSTREKVYNNGNLNRITNEGNDQRKFESKKDENIGNTNQKKTNSGESDDNMKLFKPDRKCQQKTEPISNEKDALAQPNAISPEKKPSVGFFLPLSSDENSSDFAEEKLGNDGNFKVQRIKTIQECLREHKPQCYRSIKERDDFLIAIRRERQIVNETILREALESDMATEEIDEFLRLNYRDRQFDLDEKRRLKAFWELYRDSQKVRENKENAENDKKSYIISSKEMKERTQRLRMGDPVIRAKQRREAEERRKMASRNLQKMFSTNLRQFQRLGSVNIPDRLKLAPLPRPR